MKIIEFVKRNWVYLFLGLIIISIVGTLLLVPKERKDDSQNSDNQTTQKKQPIIIYGDSRDGHEIHQKLVKTMIELSPAAVFHTGDLINVGLSTGDWADFNRITKELRDNVKFYPALGNHEMNSDLYFNNFDLPGNERWYTVDLSNVHFIVLDSNTNLVSGSEQYNWLEEDLKNYKPQDMIVAIFHHPIFSSGEHGGDTNLQNILIPLFEQYDVDAVFSGHDHDYERSFKDPIYYIVTGGGGAPLYAQKSTNIYSQKFLKSYHFCVLKVGDNKINVEIFDQNSQVIDSFVIE